MHWEGIEPSTTGFVDRSSYPIELPVLMHRPMRRGVLDSPASRLSGGCSASELTAREHCSLRISNAPSWTRTNNLRDVSAALLPFELQAQTKIGPAWNRTTDHLL